MVNVSELSRRNIVDLHKQYLNDGLAGLLGMLDLDRKFVRAEGCSVFGEDGLEYLDFLGGYGALNLGHNPPEVWEAIQKSFGAPNILQTSLNPYAAKLAEMLAEIAPGKLQRTFFCNSGAESTEAAMKFARAATGKKKIISLQGSFHGKTMGALSMTGKSSYQESFIPMVPDCVSIPINDTKALYFELTTAPYPAAFIVEPVMGEGGVIIHQEGYLKEAQKLCHDRGALLIVDEVQTGFGRTGKMFACEHEGILPDIMCLAKSLGGGLIPIGATMTTDVVWQKAMGGTQKCLRHTSTFGGNTFACAAGIATIESILRQDLADKASTLGNYLKDKLKAIQRRHKFIKDVRGKGLLIGIEFDSGGLVGKAAFDYIGSMVAGTLFKEHRIITAYTLNNPAVVRIEPPLVVSIDQIDYFLNAFESVMEKNGSIAKMGVASAKTAIGGLFRQDK